jgi:hypothetical protein
MIMEPFMSEVSRRQRPSCTAPPTLPLDFDIQNIDNEIDHIKQQLDQLEIENRLIQGKEAFLLMNLRFRRNKRGIDSDDIPGSEIIRSFEEIDLDEQDKVSMRSNDLVFDDSQCSDSLEEDEEVVVVPRK